MPSFYETRKVGTRTENAVKEILERYADRVYSNIRIPTLYTQQGDTEIDLISSIDNCILIVEVKNVRRIEGAPLQSYWMMEGASAGEPYQTLNVFTQNRIHVRAFKRFWFELRHEFPLTLAVVVVPNECVLPDSLQEGGVLTIGEFGRQLAELKRNKSDGVPLCYSLDYTVAKLKELSGGE